MKVYIIGIKGFIGSNLRRLFEQDGHCVSGHGRSEPYVDGEYDLLVDATHQIGTQAIKEHTECVFHFCVKSRVKRIVLLQSFASIEAKQLSLNKSALNFGLTYSGCSNYGADKVEIEKQFIGLLSSSDITLELHYLSAVFGDRGAWRGLKNEIGQLYSDGYTLFMPELKRFFFADVESVYRSVCIEGENKVNRYLVFDDQSLSTSMSELLLPNEKYTAVQYPYNSQLLYRCLLLVKIIPHRIAFKLISAFDSVTNKLLAKRKKMSFPAFSYWDAFYFQDKWADELARLKNLD